MDGLGKLFSGMRISATGLTAERMRIDVIAENIANARTTRTPEGGPYIRKVVGFAPVMKSAFGSSGEHSFAELRAEVFPDLSSKPQLILEPGHPDANEKGMVAYPNVNTVMEMADLITALRAYEANLTAQENFVKMAERALRLMR